MGCCESFECVEWALGAGTMLLLVTNLVLCIVRYFFGGCDACHTRLDWSKSTVVNDLKLKPLSVAYARNDDGAIVKNTTYTQQWHVPCESCARVAIWQNPPGWSDGEPVTEIKGDAVGCPQCQGNGTIYNGVCQLCGGLTWVERSKLRSFVELAFAK